MQRSAKSFVIVLLILAVLIGTALFERHSLWLLQSSERIRGALLAQTPLGSSVESVFRRLQVLDYHPVQSSKGFLRQAPGEPITAIGASSIEARLGTTYFQFPFLPTTVVAFWGFDDRRSLKDVWVWKTTDAP